VQCLALQLKPTRGEPEHLLDQLLRDRLRRQHHFRVQHELRTEVQQLLPLCSGQPEPAQRAVGYVCLVAPATERGGLPKRIPADQRERVSQSSAEPTYSGTKGLLLHRQRGADLPEHQPIPDRQSGLRRVGIGCATGPRPGPDYCCADGPLPWWSISLLGVVFMGILWWQRRMLA
jgi:hypothetical protein